MCQVVDHYHVHCQHTFRYRLVNRFPIGCSLEGRCCKANENQVIGERPFYPPPWCTDCRNILLKEINEAYGAYKAEVRGEGERQGWSEQMIRDAVQRLRDERAKEKKPPCNALAEVEDREEAFSTIDWPRDYLGDDDSELGQHRLVLSDEEEDRAMQRHSESQDDSGSEDRHPDSSPGVGTAVESSGDERSDPEAEALPYFGFLRSTLLGQGNEFEVRSIPSDSDGDSDEDSWFDDEHSHKEAHVDSGPDRMEVCNDSEPDDLHIRGSAQLGNRDSSDSDEADRMDICDSEETEIADHDSSAADLNVHHAGREVDIKDNCVESEIGFADLDDDNDGYEADNEDDWAAASVGIEINYDGWEADEDDNCGASDDDFDSPILATVVRSLRMVNLQRQT